jgi:hypothetical protein
LNAAGGQQIRNRQCDFEDLDDVEHDINVVVLAQLATHVVWFEVWTKERKSLRTA